MIAKDMVDLLNFQINRELFSEYLYISMAAYFSAMGLRGFENFFLVQAQEEHAHAMLIYDYLNVRGGRVILSEIETPKTDFTSPLEVFEIAYRHETEVSKLINNIMDIATVNKDYSSLRFFGWFVDEQIEEENSMLEIIKNLKLIKSDSLALILMDTDFKKRVFVPPVIN